jgi:hypothetical protein
MLWKNDKLRQVAGISVVSLWWAAQGVLAACAAWFLRTPEEWFGFNSTDSAAS